MELKGKSVSPGIAMGAALVYRPFEPCINEQPLPEGGEVEALRRYDEALARAGAELDALEARLTADEPDKAAVVAAHRDILRDPAMDEEIRQLVRAERLSPDCAAARVYDMFRAVLSRSKNKLMRERASDLADVKLRLLRCWAGEPEHSLASLAGPVIVVAEELFPSDTAGLDRKNVLGIVTETGGATSHTAIIARGYEIPAVLGVEGATERICEGEFIICDAERGLVLTEPCEGEIRDCEARAAAFKERAENERKFLRAVPVTQDGTRIEILLNIGSGTGPELERAEYSDGSGLFRTEFLYQSGECLPDEAEQFEAYKKVLAAFGGKAVTLRTMDIGGDKQIPALELPKEENPFLGLRGLRLSLEREAAFRAQLRAALRASAFGKLKLMLPMVGGLDELRDTKRILEEEKAKLTAEGADWDRDIKLGIMVEVPSVALIAEHAAREADFASVGTNDLTQYLCAADRGNPLVRRYYQEYHPALFRLLGELARAFGAAGKELGVCGELGGDALAIPALIGLGIRRLSMGPAALARAKKVVCGLDLAEAEKLATRVCSLATNDEVRAALESFAAEGKVV